MNKVYLVVPLILLVVFGGVYSRFRRSYDARVAAAAQTARDAAERREQQQLAARLAAQKEAAAMLEHRAQERLAREQEEEAQRAARAGAEQRRADAAARVGALRIELNRRREDIAIEGKDVAWLERKKIALLEEHELLTASIHQAESGRRAFRDLLEQLNPTAAPGAAFVRLDAAPAEPPRGQNPRKLP